MLDKLKSLPDDPAELKGMVSLMGKEIKGLTLKIEYLLGQLAINLQEDREIGSAAEAQATETPCGEVDPANASTAAIIWSR